MESRKKKYTAVHSLNVQEAERNYLSHDMGKWDLNKLCWGGTIPHPNSFNNCVINYPRQMFIWLLLTALKVYYVSK